MAQIDIFTELREFAAGCMTFFETIYDVSLWRILIAVTIIVVALLFKTFISKCVFKLIKKKSRHKDGSDGFFTDFLDIIDRPVRLLVISAGLYLAAAVLGLTGTFSGIVSKCVETLVLISVFTVLFGVCGYIKKAALKVTDASETHIDIITADYLQVAAKTAVIVLGILCILQVWIGDISGIIAGLSIGGIALALAAQDTAANIFGSITVMLDDPFDIGEYIEVGVVKGTVEKMGIRSTRIRTHDGSLVIVPNKTMSSANIINHTKTNRRHICFNVGVAYATDKALLESFISRIDLIVKSSENVRPESVFVNAASFTGTVIQIAVDFYTLSGDEKEAVKLRGKINLEIVDAAKELGVTVI